MIQAGTTRLQVKLSQIQSILCYARISVTEDVSITVIGSNFFDLKYYSDSRLFLACRMFMGHIGLDCLPNQYA